MRDGIFCSLRRLLSFMKMRNTYAKSTQMLRKISCVIFNFIKWLDVKECNS